MLPVSECALHTLPINHPRQSVYEVITRRVFTHIGIAGTKDITHRIIKALYSMPALKNGDDNVGYLTVISPLGKPLDCSFPFNKKATTFGWQHAGILLSCMDKTAALAMFTLQKYCKQQATRLLFCHIVLWIHLNIFYYGIYHVHST